VEPVAGAAVSGPAEPVVVEDWTTSKSFSPTMTAQVGAAPQDILFLIATALQGQGFKVRSEGDGFKATFFSWLRFVADGWERTVLRVSARPNAGGSAVSISVVGRSEASTSRRKGREALTSAFQDAQRRGLTVTTTAWQKA
jgi:hypothetical protein